MTKKNIMPALVLGAICLVVAALLAVVNMLTAPIIAANAEAKIQASLMEVMDGATGFDEITVSGAPSTVTRIYEEKEGRGYVIILETSTSYTGGENMTVSVGISAEGKITGAKVTAYSESKDMGKESYPRSFVGLNQSEASSVDTVSGVTYSSAAFKAVINDAFLAVKAAESSKADPDERTAAALLGVESATEITDSVTLTEPLMRVWYAAGRGFAVLSATKNDYDPTVTDTEVFTAVGLDGKVIDIHIKTWVHGEGTTFTPEFEDSFAGLDGAGVDGVDVITGSTGTSNKVKNSVKAALELVNSGAYEMISSALFGTGALTEVEGLTLTDPVKRVWSCAGGYLVYTSTKHDYDPTLTDTELLVMVEDSGKIKGIHIMTWVHGEGTTYNPEFEAAFGGLGADGIDSVDAITGSTGTSTKVKNSVKAAIGAASDAECERVKALIEDTLGESVGVVRASLGGVVKFIYQTSDGYVAYTATKHDYSPTLTDTELLVSVDNGGKIKEVKILTWVHGEGTTFTPEFEAAFGGLGADGVDGVDTITGSTGTSNKVKNSVKAALAAIEEVKGGE